MFEYYNENPNLKVYKKGKHKGQKEVTSDCIVRAMSLLFKKSWLETYDILCAKGREMCRLPNSNDVYRSFLKHSKISSKVEKEDGTKRYLTVKEFAEITKGTDTGYIVDVSRHTIYVCNGKYYDAWDSGNCKVRKIQVLK